MNQFEILTALDVARFIPLLCVFAYASWQDYKTGEVSNKAWLYAPAGATFVLLEYVFFARELLITAFISATVCVVLAYLLFKVKTGWGGADAKALMTLAVCYPLAPAYLVWLPLYPMLIVGVASAIAVFVMLVKRKRELRFIPSFFMALILMAVI